jgi:hypothetical protein
METKTHIAQAGTRIQIFVNGEPDTDYTVPAGKECTITVKRVKLFTDGDLIEVLVNGVKRHEGTLANGHALIIETEERPTDEL